MPRGSRQKADLFFFMFLLECVTLKHLKVRIRLTRDKSLTDKSFNTMNSETEQKDDYSEKQASTNLKKT